MTIRRETSFVWAAIGVVLSALAPMVFCEAVAADMDGYQKRVKPFFDAHCIRCHGPTKNKGQIALHALDGDLSKGEEPEKWENILEMLKSGQMPPDDEPQPDAVERQAVADWIEAGLRDHVKAASLIAPAATTRRLTNFEYQNTMRDLLGFELHLTKHLPEDPEKPYHFNNTAEFMLIGPEQIDIYLENARRAMASAIVDPVKPEIHRTAASFDSQKGQSALTGMRNDELGVYGNRRGSVGDGIALKSWPKTGEYRIRIKAAAILPHGTDQVPLRLIMGTTLRHDAGTGNFAPVGTIVLRNSVDQMQEFEFRGRIENHPFQPGDVTANGQQPPRLMIHPQNLFDNGELNDHRRSAFDDSWQFSAPRVVLRSIEFEAPVSDVWPPQHHTRILFDSPLRSSDPKAYVREVLRRFMSRAYRRPVLPQELDRFVKVHETISGEFETFEAAMRETLALVLVSPQFLYHTAFKEGVTTRQFELASRLSYFLWGSMPDDELHSLAAAGTLDDPGTLKTQVIRLLKDERSHHFVHNFTTQWLSIAKMKAVKINLELFPRFLYTYHVGERSGQEVLFRPTIRDYMHEETVGFIAELLRRNASVMNIIESDFAWLNEPLAVHYGVEGVKGIEMRPVPIRPEHRLGGLLTQGSILIGNSTGSAPHPIYRAVWLREAIMGEKVNPPPAEVPALVDTVGAAAEKSVMIKDLLRQHRQVESCNDCHVRLDPWGIPFEEYNAVGHFQPRVPADGVRVRGYREEMDKSLAGYKAYLDSINTVPVQADARVPHGPKINGMSELKAYLHKHRKDDIVENMVRRLLTYAIGRELTYRDRFAVEQLVKESKQNQDRLADMIVSICQSELFRGVKPEER